MKALFSHPMARVSINVVALLSMLVVSLFTSIGVQPAGATPWYVRDQFGAAAYTNNDGSVNWVGNWTEQGDDAAAGTGEFLVTGNWLRIQDTDNITANESVYRMVNLSSAASATLSFYYRNSNNLEGTDTVVVEMSRDGGTTYPLTLFTSAGVNQANSTRYTVEITDSSYFVNNARLRFRVSNDYSAGEYFEFDNVEVAYTVGGSQTSTSVLQTVQTYYVPVPEDQALKAMVEIENGGPSNAPESPTFVYISITVNTDGTVIYYDHWEDDFETTINAPVQDTTDVWGDNNTANGVPPGYSTDVLNQGDIIILNNRVDVGASWPTPRVVKYDGGDKLAATQAIAVTRTSWASVTGTLHGGSVEMLNTEVWGERFDIPADYTVDPVAGGTRDFEYAALAVMALRDGTQIYRNGSLVTTINEGQSYLFENIGGTNSAAANYIVMGDRITTNAGYPVQANFLTGDIATNYSSSWLTLYPYDLLSNTYYSVVPGFATPARVTRVYMENPNSSAITVYYQGYGDATASTVTVNGYSSNWVTLSTTADKGYRFWTTGSPAPKFQAVSIIDSEAQASDWGYTLIPDNQLTQQAQAGWGYGQDPTMAYTENGSPIWVIAVDKTSPYTTSQLNVCADYDGDGLGSLTDSNGHRYDQLIQLYHLQQAKIYDSDGDQTGMLLYLCNGSESNRDYSIAVAWGQDPTTATAGSPGLDVGTSVPPLPNFTAIKDAELTNDLNGDGKFDLGDSFEYQIVINNTGALPIPADTITVEDIVPQYTTYVPNSTRVNGVLAADNSSPATPFPLDEGGLLINKTLPIEGLIVVTFQVTIDNDLPGSTNIQNEAKVSGLDLEYDPWVQIVVDPPQKIGDFIWLDLDGDGVQDTGEPGIPGVTVRLYAANNSTLLATTTTNNSGQYTFSGLTASTTYYVRVDPATLPGGLTQTGDPDATRDNQHQVALGTTPYYTADFGYQGNVSIGDFVWYDIDRDGVQDGGSEVGLNNVTVNLTWAGPDGNLSTTADNGTFTAVTNSSGGYDFTGLPAGTYRVDLDETSLPANYGLTTTDPLNTGALAAGADYNNADFGAAPGATISNFVWNDLDADGTQDAGEGGIPDVRVYIDADGDNTYDVGERYESTDANGNYAITNLAPGTYAVRIDTTTLPASSTQTYDLDGIGTSHEASVTVTAGQVRTDADFGYQLGVLSIAKSSDVSNVVLPGDTITYTLTVRNNSGATQSGIVVTDALPSGTSYVSSSTFVTHPGITNGTYRDNFGTVAYNNSAGTQSWTSNSWSETGETTSPSADQIYINGGELTFVGGGGTNSIERQMDLSGATSATLTYDCRASLNHEATDTVVLAASNNGGSSWTNLGSITLNTINGANCAASFESFNILSYASASTRIRFTHTGSANDELFYVDNFQVQYSTSATTRDNISGGSYADLYNGTPPVLVHQNDAYSLTNGQSMTITYQVTVNNAVARASIDNTASVTSAQQTTPQYASVSDPLPSSSVGDTVWLDEDGDGDQDAGEAGIPNVRLTLMGQDADGNTVSLSTYTDSNGRYVFSGLVPSDSAGYTVTVDSSSLPAGLAVNPTYDENGVGTAHTTNFVLNAATEYMTADFGYNWSAASDTNNNTGAGAIGDRVWIDADGDGRLDSGEAGLAGVTVTLYYDPDGNGVFDTQYTVSGYTPTATTDAAGNYIFDNLPAGTYRVVTTPPGGVYTATGDPDHFGTSDNETILLLARGDVMVNADFGYQPSTSYTIGDQIFFDADGNGSFGGSDTGIPGVSVALLDSAGDVIATTFTNSSGVYSFPGLPNATYTVWVNDTANVLDALVQTGTPNNSANNGQACGACNDQNTVALGSANNANQDFGYAPAAHGSTDGLIGDTIFLDANGNGAFNAGEAGMEGVIVRLYDSTGTTLLASTITDENGKYYFGNLTVGTYVVRVTPPAGYSISYDPNGGADSQSSVTLASGSMVNLNQDFGYRGTTTTGTIGDFIWNDANASGAFDTDEAGITGVTVDLYQDRNGNGTLDAEDALIGTTVTAGGGAYSFSGLATDDGGSNAQYLVDVTDTAGLLAGYWASNGSAGTNNNSQADPYAVTLTAGSATNNTADFGYYLSSTAISNLVWEDLNANGLQDAGEPGIPNVIVTLWVSWPPGGSNPIYRAVTDATGQYSFDNLLLDEDFDGVGGPSVEPAFSVRVTMPAGYTATQILAGSDRAIDSNEHAGSVAAPTENTSDTSMDFGYWRAAAIIGVVQRDTNHDGTGDAPLGGVILTLWTDPNGDGDPSDGAPVTFDVDPGTTGGQSSVLSSVVDGAYTFANVPPGVAYVIVETHPTGYLHVGQSDTTADNPLTPVDASPSTNRIPVTPSSGETDSGNAFVEEQVGSIGGHTYEDVNGNGTYDAGTDTPLTNVKICLDTGNDGACDIGDPYVNSDSVTGAYTFDNLTPGTYHLVEVNPDGFTSSGASAPGGTVVTSDRLDQTLAAGQNKTDNDFLDYQPAAIGDYVWLDRDNDGIQDPADEPGIRGVIVNLLDSGNNVLQTTTTEEDGAYNFTGLIPGSYRVEYILPGGSPALQNQGGDDAGDSDADITTGRTDLIVLTSGQLNDTVDAGFYTLRMDLGDLPNNYRTLFRPGPAHIVFPDNENNDTHAAGADGQPDVIAGGPIAVWLGLVVDVEANGQPDPSAFLDDVDQTADDEDGLALAASGWIVGQSSTATITVNSSEATRVYYAYWIDWGNNGSFLDANDGFYNGYLDTASPASTTITVAVPGSYTAGTNVYMRLRASETPLTRNDFEGTISNGEVEDYWYKFDAGGTSTPITLSYFYAQQDGMKVNFSWSTATETGNAGFNLYTETDGKLVLVNSELIKSNVIDSLARQDYSFSAGIRGNVFYIEDVSVLGERVLHGPFEIGRVYGDRLAADQIDLAAINAETVAKKETRQKSIREEIAVPAPVRSDAVRGPVALAKKTKVPKPTMTPAPTRTAKTTQTPKIKRTATPITTATITRTATPAATLTPTFAPTVMPTLPSEATITMEATATDEPTATVQPTATDKLTATATIEPSATPTLMVSPTSTPATYATAMPVDPASLQLTTTLYLKVRKTGIYRVTYESLRDAGLDLAGVAVSKLTLINRDQMIPIYVYSPDQAETFGPGGFLEFYGEALDTLYTDTNVYTVQVSNSPVPRIPTMSAAPQVGITPEKAYPYTLRVNNQKVYGSTLPGSDPWYDTALQVAKTQKSWSFTFQVNGLADPSAESVLELVTKGYSSSSVSPDHHLRVSVNGVLLANETFDGIAEHSLRVTLPPGTLVEGTNTLQLTLPADTGAISDVVLLDKYSVTYSRVFQAQSGELTFASSGGVFQVTGLPGTNVVAYRLVGNGLARLGDIQVQSSGNDYTAAFSGTDQADSYLIATVEALKTPTLEAARTNVDLNRPAEYLIISHPDFISGLQPLIAARQAQGLTVNVVDVNDLYAQYSGGVFDPMAIKQYIAYAAKNLGTQYVLLVGGDTYDYRNYLGRNSVSFIPSLYVATGPLAKSVPSDPLYADVDNDNVPDLAIGRFPVRTTAELNMVVSKTLAYGNKGYGRTSVFVSDVNDGDLSFKTISAQLAAGLPADWSATRIDLEDTDTATAKANLLTTMNNGTALVTFVGHSGPQAWTFSNLFTNADAAALTNTEEPFVVVQWGCWNTYYVHPIYDYLVQKFLFSGDRGAVAVFGATTLADSESERMLGELLTPRLVTPGMTIGQALRDAKLELAKTHPDMLDMLLGFSLMGDPALVIQP